MILKVSKAFRWHTLISWIGGIGILLFAFSGILHPLMSWTGPQAKNFMPPQTLFSDEHFLQTQAILKKYSFEKTSAVKLVPGPDAVLLQITENFTSPRRYFNLQTSEELQDYEQKYAQWLAVYYTGLADAEIAQTEFQTEFDSAYPWVNRLLPVYKISFNDSDKTSVYIYTELGILAGITNTYKTRLQSIFSALHTWSWLGEDNPLRFIIVFILVGSVVAMVLTGIILVFGFKRQKPFASQRWHRYLGLLLWVPLGFFSISGTYHLIQGEISPPARALIPAPSLLVENFNDNAEVLYSYESLPDKKLTGANLISWNDQLLYRLTAAPEKTTGDRATRFAGAPSEGQAIYLDAKTGKPVMLDEKALATYYAKLHFPGSDVQIRQLTQITGFGNGYDFRNKRLPVWRVEFKSGTVAFIDNATGFLVDQTTPAAALESLSFSFLHKYNFLTPLVGRFNRDVIMVSLLVLAIGTSLIGYRMLWRRQR